jgi:septal ring factor EnvC (AmiA/AmiB activator)
MAGRSRSSFNKRLKERSRQEKQREKAEKRVQRKQEKPDHTSDDDLASVDFSAARDQLALPNSNE